jgi:uncharacterized surface protein with fasciclin (FAS1) repeats
MVSLGPDIQPLNYTHMTSLVDYRGKECPQILPNKGSIYAHLQTDPQFSLFRTIVEKISMQGQLNEEEADFTIFAPVDKYLSKIPREFFDKMDNGMARQIFNASTLNRKIDKDLLISSPVCYLTTRNPKMRMYVTNINDKTRINNRVSVVHYDLVFNNGIIHVVDGLIFPNEDIFLN